jgi:hypothetical protein
MHPRLRRCAALVLLCVPSLAAAEGFDPESPKTWLEQALEQFHLAAPAPTTSTVENEASSSTGNSTALVNRASFTRLVAAALESGLGQGTEDQVFTFSLNLFSMAAYADSSLLLDNDRYQRYSNLRRLAGSITLGGTPDDSTGVPADARPRSITDIVQVNAKWRFHGSRDRRDHWSRYRALSLHDPTQALLDFSKLPGVARAIVRAADDEERYAITLETLSEHPEVVSRLTGALAEYNRQLDSLNQWVDHGFVVSLNVSGDFRRQDLGTDKFFAELVGEEAHWADLTFNVGFRSDQASSGEHDQELRVAAAVSKRMLRGPLVPEGLDASLGIAGDLRNHHRASLWSANAKVDFPLRDGLELVVSLTWSNRSDLIDERLVRGNFGLTYDFGGLWP